MDKNIPPATAAPPAATAPTVAPKLSRLPVVTFPKHQDCEHYRPHGHGAGLCAAHPPVPMIAPGMNRTTGKMEPELRMFYPEVQATAQACGEFCQATVKLPIPDIEIAALPLSGAN